MIHTRSKDPVAGEIMIYLRKQKVWKEWNEEDRVGEGIMHEVSRNRIMWVSVSYAKHVLLFFKSNEMPLMALASRDRVNLFWDARHRME